MDDGESDPADTAADFDAESPADGLAAGLAAHVERWSLRLGAPAPAARAAADAAAALSRATGAGHVCLTLDELADDDDPGRRPARTPRGVARRRRRHARPASRRWCSTPTAGSTCTATSTTSAALAARLERAARPVAWRGWTPATQRPAGRTLCRQRAAPAACPTGSASPRALALRQRLAVVSGGPGTGKTTTVVALLACLLAREPGAAASRWPRPPARPRRG
ncbi:MAG: hypothetical protein MZW92_28695 [Comamonadaceae bacterium]|nr:hypothetical protein [Comamonadaceae bacterium]